MIRETDLVSYLPLFVAEFKEISAVLKAEDPEFTFVWSAADRVLKNEFIETADEYGLSRFENLLNIFPEPTDPLEIRRTRIMARWFVALPYTLRTLIKKLISLCGENNFAIETDFDHYRIKVETMFDFVGQIQEVENLLEQIVPANIIINTRNNIAAETSGIFYVGGTVCQTLNITVSSELRENIALNGWVKLGGCICEHKRESIE